MKQIAYSLSPLLTAAYLLIAVTLQALFKEMYLEDTYLFLLALVAVIVIISGPLKGRLQYGIERANAHNFLIVAGQFKKVRQTKIDPCDIGEAS